MNSAGAFRAIIHWCVGGALILSVSATRTRAQNAPAKSPQIERPLSFDAAGRVLVLTPTVAARWKLSSPDWPLGTDWREARLFITDTISRAAVLVVNRVDGAVARYAYSSSDIDRLRSMVDAAVVAQGGASDAPRGSTGTVLSEPAGNAFVRNQTFLGLLAYGPATAAILSDNGAAASGGYLMAAGASFFVAAKMVRDRSVTRAQTLLAFHGGTRGAIMGGAFAAMANADGGPGYGAPILAGALGGTIAGFRGARAMSDGEAASSGFGADLAAVTTLGIAGALGAFKDDTASSSNNIPSRGKAALGSAIAAGLVGYMVGPRYARRSAYNVTAGDIDVSFTSAALGGLAVNSVLGDGIDAKARFAVTTGGILGGALIADRTMVRHADRSSSDGTLVQLGSIAGMLMGGGLALMAEMDGQAAIASVTAGGILGLTLSDHLIRPAPDAGPRRGVLPRDGASNASNGAQPSRLSLSIVPAATSIMLARRTPRAIDPLNGRVRISNVPVMRLSF